MGSSFELQSVSVVYPRVAALSDVTFSVKPGELVALVGASGSGKSTLLNTLNGSVAINQGVVKIDGIQINQQSLTNLRKTRSKIGFVHQHLNLLPNVRVLHNVLLGRLGQFGLLESIRNFLFPPKRYVEEVYSILARVGIEDKLFARTDSLSGGQQQRVAVARALFQRPLSILADEPVSSVDPARARDTVQLMVSLAMEHKLTLIMSLHNFELAKEFFPRLVGLRAGRVVLDAPTSEVSDSNVASLYQLEAAELIEEREESSR